MATDIDQRIDASIEHLREEMGKLRTGRASSQLIEGLMIDAYGTPTPLQHVAQINVQDAQSLVIQPFDPGTVAAIEKAFQESDLGLNPAVDGNVLRLTIPPMTEERRKDLVQVLGSLTEEARVSVRNVREEAMKGIKSDDDMSEDEKKGKESDLSQQIEKPTRAFKR